jgi:hypothetical protein
MCCLRVHRSAAAARPSRRLASHSRGRPVLVGSGVPALVHVLVDGGCDGLVGAACLVLVDHGGPLGVVAIRAMRSRSPALLLAANWLPVCRRSSSRPGRYWMLLSRSFDPWDV